MRDGFIKVAAGSPRLRVADCRYNAEQVFTLMREAHHQGVRVLVLPELCLTGASCGDLFFQDTLLRGAEDALKTVLAATRGLDMLTAVGLPVRSPDTHRVYDCAAVLHKGRILGLVPKTVLSAQQRRWFAPGPKADRGSELVGFAGQDAVTLTTGLAFGCTTLPELVVGVELGEDAAAVVPPAAGLTRDGGVTLMLHLSADWEGAGRAEARRQLVCSQSARLLCGYLSAGAGEGESTTDQVCGGHCLAAEKGLLLAERRFTSGLAVTELDLSRLTYERRRCSFRDQSDPDAILWAEPFALEPATTTLTRPVSVTPFIPEDVTCRAERCEELIKISALGLKQRLEHTHAKSAVIGLSGGLDSTLAILITAVAMQLLDRPMTDIVAVTMPCFGTTERTRDNAVELATHLGCTLKRIDISNAVKAHFKDIGQSMDVHDVTFENGQARERTQVLMDIANQESGLVIGTGDLSELALGWATYNGDHMSMYAVNAGFPKTLVRYLVHHICGDKTRTQPELASVLADILDTPVSPELLPAIEGKISQKTEDLVGPYLLHDFFLYYVVRWGFAPRKVLRLAEYAFARTYDRPTILKWLRTFYRRFFAQQFKRSCLPDGVSVGSVGLSPRGGWAMPSDAVASLWLEELEGLE